MKSFVVEVVDSVCLSNNRDPEAKALIDACKSFGRVEPLETVLEREKAAWQRELIELREKYEAILKAKDERIRQIEEYDVSSEELTVLRAIRKKSENEATDYKRMISERDNQLRDIQLENENRSNAIKAIFGIN